MDNNEKKYNVTEEGIGSVQIADEVVAVIVAIAATEVEGVAAMGENITNEIMSKVGIKNLAKGVKLSIDNMKVSVEVKLTVEYGYNIPATCAKVQEKVKNTVENMTGLTVTDVDVRITGVGVKKA
ncbi:MAG: Asp23/Gls24 family envelope stress response protein [Lachnospiraceae bacterium]|nr:Asp23/Gls24 family envelope stress response protein [Lachnospiraceae bacterium]